METYFNEWEEKVLNTSPISISVWTVEVPLCFRTIDNVSSGEAMRASYRRLSEVIGWHTLGTTFLCQSSHDESGYEEDTGESLYVWPARWTVVAKDADQALLRFKELRQLLDCIAIDDEWLPKFQMQTQLRADSFVPTQQTFEPAYLVTNHPLHSRWTDPDVDTVDTEAAINQITRIREIQRLELQTSTVQEAKRSLDALVNLLPLVEIDVYNWKWVIIAAHNALQNFMVAALEGTSPGRVLIHPRSSASDSSSETYGDPALLKFDELYDRIKKDRFMMMNIDSMKYSAQGSVGSSMKRLNDLRNDFTHFDPKTLVLGPESVVTLPRMLEDIFNVIEFLAFESHNVRWHVYPIEKVETKLLLADVREILDDLAEKYWKRINRLKVGLSVSRVRLASHRK